MGLEILFLLLPVAALSGWWIGRQGEHRHIARRAGELSRDYLKGLNYLISEQPDQAIEVFVRMLEVDSDTIETHFALGSLFRRRGEVDRAIRIHQNLIARPSLTGSHRNQALFELGLDYFAAGLLDRAESLFTELSKDGEFGARALQQLQDLYEQEREWAKAITVAESLNTAAGSRLHSIIAQYHCELAEQAWENRDLDNSLKLVRKALATDRDCVRASLLEAQLRLAQTDPKGALSALARIEEQDPEYLPEALEWMRKAYAGLGRDAEFTDRLGQLLKSYGGTSILLALAHSVHRQQGDTAAAAVLTEHLHGHPSVLGLRELVGLKLGATTVHSREDLVLVLEFLTRLLAGKPRYRCNRCGFYGKTLHWQCPSCRQWNSVKPIQGIEGE